MSRRAVFLDRDGVINQYNSDYVRVPSDFEFYPDAEEAFRVLGTLSVPIVIVTNQSGIGRGYTTKEIVDTIHAGMVKKVERWGATITSVEVCPHTPTDDCHCRKPADGLFTRAAEAHDLQLTDSFLVGDSWSDIVSARRSNLRAVRVRTGRGAEPLPVGVRAEVTVDGLFEAAQWIAEHWDTPPPRPASW